MLLSVYFMSIKASNLPLIKAVHKYVVLLWLLLQVLIQEV